MTNCTKEPENDAVKTHNDAIDLISRADAIEAIRTLQTFKLFEGDDMILIDKSEVQTELMTLPSAEKTGKWVDDNGRPYKGKPNGSCWCGKCGEWLVASDEYNVSTSYCPNCGVRMLNGGE